MNVNTVTDARSGSTTGRGGPRAASGKGEPSEPSLAGPPGTDDAALDAYTYGLLDPRVGAAGDNLPLLGATTLGIEVTVPELARRCGLGNIDPQHGGGVGIGAAGAAAAIEACLTVTPPPAGATLVTVRPDLDAFGAMALLAFRRADRPPSAAMRERIDRAARADRFDHGPWPGPRPLPATAGECRPAGWSPLRCALHRHPVEATAPSSRRSRPRGGISQVRASEAGNRAGGKGYGGYVAGSPPNRRSCARSAATSASAALRAAASSAARASAARRAARTSSWSSRSRLVAGSCQRIS